MRRLRERVEGLCNCSAAKLLLRLCVVMVALGVDLIASCAKQCRRKQLRGCAQQVGGEVDCRG